jgi:phosphoglycolate phosphatase
MSLAQFRLWVFDLDGTLIDSRYDLVTAVNATLAHLKLLPLPEDVIVPFIGDGAEDLIRRSLQAAGMPSPEIRDGLAETMRWVLDYYGEHCLDRTAPYPGALKLLDVLSARGLPLAVLTNKPEKPALKILAHLGILNRITHVIPGDGPLGKKPDPAGLAYILKDVNASPNESVLVGDSLQDLQTARAAGVSFVAFLGGLGDRMAITAATPDVTVTRLTEITDLLAPPDHPASPETNRTTGS